PPTPTLSLHDALPIYGSSDQAESNNRTPTRTALNRIQRGSSGLQQAAPVGIPAERGGSAKRTGLSQDAGFVSQPPREPDVPGPRDRKSTRLNSSHSQI